MVFVQSFWSKPFLNADSNEFNYRISGGFLDKRYFYYCWALSFLSLKNFGEKCVLVTDNLGKYLLVEALGLEYDEVRLYFNELDNLSSSYWAIPKLHVYKSMREPFIHFDGDLILYPGFKDLGLIDRDLVFEFKNDSLSDDHLKSISYLDEVLFGEIQSGVKSSMNLPPYKEKFPNMNHSILAGPTGVSQSIEQLDNSFHQVSNPRDNRNSSETNLNDEINPSQANPGVETYPNHQFSGESCGSETAELNCGVIGGKDYKFLNEFASWSLDLFNKNLGILDTEFLKYNKNFINSYFEQYLLYRYINQKGKIFSCIYENNPRELYQRDFFLPVNNSSRIMTHFILNLKIKYSLEIELKLRLNYPHWHARINDLIDRNII